MGYDQIGFTTLKCISMDYPGEAQKGVKIKLNPICIYQFIFYYDSTNNFNINECGTFVNWRLIKRRHLEVLSVTTYIKEVNQTYNDVILISMYVNRFGIWSGSTWSTVIINEDDAFISSIGKYNVYMDMQSGATQTGLKIKEYPNTFPVDLLGK